MLGSRVILSTSKGPEVTASVRWFDKYTGQGQVRLASGRSVPVYACNMIGADSYYPHLVTNVTLTQGDVLNGTLDDTLGLTYFKMVI
jgi:hypothetical protein